MSAREAHYSLLAGDLDAARKLLDECTNGLAGLCERFDDAQVWREPKEHRAGLARLLIAERHFDEACALLTPRLPELAANRHGWRLGQTLVQLAIAERGRGDIDAAMGHFAEALRRTKEARPLRLFLEEGPDVGALVVEMLDRSGTAAVPAAIGAWLREISEAFSAMTAAAGAARLTRRENDVFGRLRDGKSNNVIARELNITDNAVKYHLKNIYRKLGVNDRRSVSGGKSRI